MLAASENLCLVDPRLEPVLERDHQLDAFERAQPELLERRGAADVAAAGEPADQRFERVALRRRQRLSAGIDPVADGRALQLLRPFGARAARFPARPRSSVMR